MFTQILSIGTNIAKTLLAKYLFTLKRGKGSVAAMRSHATFRRESSEDTVGEIFIYICGNLILRGNSGCFYNDRIIKSY